MDPKENLPIVGVGQSARLDDRYMVNGFDYCVKIALSNLGANLPVQGRVVLGIYRKLDSTQFDWTSSANNTISNQLNSMLPGGSAVSLTAPIVSTSNLTILYD